MSKNWEKSSPIRMTLKENREKVWKIEKLSEQINLNVKNLGKPKTPIRMSLRPEKYRDLFSCRVQVSGHLLRRRL